MQPSSTPHSSSHTSRQIRTVVMQCSIAVLLLICTALLLPPTLQAQCPPGYLSNTVVLTPADIPALPCNVTVVYCYPNPAPVPPDPYITPQTQIVIQSWTFACGSGGFVMTPSLMDQISGELLQSAPGVVAICNSPNAPTCSPWCEQHPNCICPGGYASWNVTDGGCLRNWTWGIGGTETRIEPCYGVDRCISIYQICCFSGSIRTTWMASDNGTLNCSSDPLCYQVCYDGTGGVGCCDQNGNPLSRCPDGSCPDRFTGCCAGDPPPCP